MNFRKNIGTADRIARIVLGLIIISVIPLAFIGPRTSLALLGFLGIIPLVFGVIGYCPPYDLLGINTYRSEKTVIQ